MGFFKSLLSIAAPIVGSIFGGPVGAAIGGAIGGAVSGGGLEGTLLGAFGGYVGSSLLGGDGGLFGEAGGELAGEALSEAAASAGYEAIADEFGGQWYQPSGGGAAIAPADMPNILQSMGTGGPTGAIQVGGPAPTLLDKVNSMFGLEKSPISMLDVGKAGANYLVQSSVANKYLSAAEQAAQRANPLADPRRGPYQAQLSQLLTNPQQFYSTNPVVQAQLDLARQKFLANTGKMGTGGTQFNDYLTNIQNVAAGTFNDQANLLAGLGGFNQGAGYSGNVFANLSSSGILQGAEAFRGIGEKIFGGFGKQPSPQQSPTSSTTFAGLA